MHPVYNFIAYSPAGPFYVFCAHHRRNMDKQEDRVCASVKQSRNFANDLLVQSVLPGVGVFVDWDQQSWTSA